MSVPTRLVRGNSRAGSRTNYTRSHTTRSHHHQQSLYDTTGLIIEDARGNDQLLFSDQEIADDIIATIPKLHAALGSHPGKSHRWRPASHKDGVEVFELAPTGDCTDDLDLGYATLAKTELKCHLNEVLNVLISQESSEYETTMRGLVGTKFHNGRVLFNQRCQFTNNMRETFTKGSDGNPEHNDQAVLLSVNMATFQPSLRVKLNAKSKRPQKLLFSSCTHQYDSKDRAVHVIKTLPKRVHDQVVYSADRSALRGELDHIGVAFDIQSTHRPGGSINQTTHIVAHGYASVREPEFFGLQKLAAHYRPADLIKRRQAVMNPEAKHVINLLTKSLRKFERVIRRRRFGFQSFVYFPSYTEDDSIIRACTVCNKTFSMFRKDFFCQLCGHMTCKECSQLYEVEARIGEIRQNRACIKCVVRVDSCVFEDQDIIAALGPVIVESDEPWFSDDDDAFTEMGSVTSHTSSAADDLRDQLYSDDPATRSQALMMLAQLVSSPTNSSASGKNSRKQSTHRQQPRAQKKQRFPIAKDLTEKIYQDVENHLTQSLRIAEKEMRPDDFIVADLDRDYALQFDATKTRSPDHPLPPMPEEHLEVKRLENIKKSGALDPNYDRSALNILAQVAAKHLNCPVGYVSMVSEDKFHAIGTFPVRPTGNEAPRVENMCSHTVYADKPLVVKNPQRDMRFAQMPIIKDAGVKFYAGFPIRAPDGSVVATLCTSDFKPHNNITAKDYATMDTLAKLAAQLVLPQEHNKSKKQVY